MKRIRSAIIVVFVALMIAPMTTFSGDGVRDEEPAPIFSRTLDLLDSDVRLLIGGDRDEWVSESFDTSQFTRIGLKAASSDSSDPITCATEWSFGGDDGFTRGLPSVQLEGRVGLRDLRGGQRPDLDPTLWTIRFGNPVGFGEVAGLRARIRCQPAFPRDINIFFNPLESLESFDPFEWEVTGGAGTLTDVKVLLRRD